MNFLAHYELAAEQSPLFRFGSMLPDFAKMGGGRVLRVKGEVGRRALSPQLREVQAGIDFHFACDEAYDELDEYRRLKATFRKSTYSGYLKSERLFQLLLPTLGADLLLDGWYQSRNPELTADVKRCVRVVGALGLEGFSTNPVGLQGVFNEFIPKIPHYSDATQVENAIGGVMLRQFDRILDRREREVIFQAMSSYQEDVLASAGSIDSAMRDFRDANLRQS